MFGGQDGAAFQVNDLHLLDLKQAPLSMQLMSVAGDPPPPRRASTLTAVSVCGRPGTEVVVLFGGHRGTIIDGSHTHLASNSVYILQGEGDNSVSISDAASQNTGLTWTEPIVCAHSEEDGVPDARDEHIAVSWRGMLVIFGGGNPHTDQDFDDTWILDVSVPVGGSMRQLLATWRKLGYRDGVRPPALSSHTGSLVGDSLYVFGGCIPYHCYNDIWKLDLSAPEPRWEELHVTGTPPPPRVSHAAVVLGDRIVFCGGRGPHAAAAMGKHAPTLGGHGFFMGGFDMLEFARGRWLPTQRVTRSIDVHNDGGDDGGDDSGDHSGDAGSDDGGDDGSDDGSTDGGDDDEDNDVHVRTWEHRSGHVMVAAEHGLLVIGGIGYTGEFQDDVLHVGLFQ